MLTQNYYNYLANAIACEGYVYSINNRKQALPLRTTRNVTIRETLGWDYRSNTSGFPYDNSPNVVYDSSHKAGIAVGSGNAPSTLDDINLEQPINSGISMTRVSITRGIDSSEDPYMEFLLSVTNTSSDPITIKEVGIRQEYYGGYGGTEAVWLMDRTVLEEPITIQPEESGTIKYRVTTATPVQYKNGIKLVSFCYGSDEDVAAMIDAAHQGLIDLQTDGHWHVGDTRIISVGAFTGSNNTNQAAKGYKIAISQFGDYNECGSVLQFDFLTNTTEGFRMFGSSPYAYSRSEMYLTTLPAFVEALPTWLKNRLIPFTVTATSIGAYITNNVETVTNNKLALRSAKEITGTEVSYFPEPDTTRIDLYKFGANRIVTSHCRHAYTGSYWNYYTEYSGTGSENLSAGRVIAPFGCL